VAISLSRYIYLENHVPVYFGCESPAILSADEKSHPSYQVYLTQAGCKWLKSNHIRYSHCEADFSIGCGNLIFILI